MQTILVNFIGDISLNDDYITMCKKGINPFLNVKPILDDSDIIIGNLECLARGSDRENLLKKPRLRTDISTLKYLKVINLGLACLANNHAYDGLEDGFIQTTCFLELNNIAYVGASISGNEIAPHFISRNNISLGILNYITEDTNPSIPYLSKVKLNYFELDRVIHDIKKLRPQVDHIVVCLHWGGKLEGSMYPDINQPKMAKKMIDAGADLIIGHHSHTLQPYEIYNGKHIFYSLGNFCFSDIFFDGKRLELDKKRTNPSVILSVDFSNTTYTVQMHGIINRDGFILPSQSVIQKNVKRISSGENIIYKFPFWNLYYFYEKRLYPIYFYFFANNRNPFKQLINLKFNSLIKHARRLWIS